jgi:hypothetical protein
LFPQASGEKLKRAADAIGVRCAVSAADAIGDADLIVSAVTAAASVDAAHSVKPHLAGQPCFLDINSVSPARKQETAKLLGDAARYIDVAVVAPIYPARHQTPLLLAGPHAEAIAPVLAALSMRASIAGAHVGAAAAIKMIRSEIMKGNYPGLDWAKVIPYNLERMASHGERRAAEMEEVAATLRELGVEPLMTAAIVKRQREMGEIGAQLSVRSALNEGRAAILSAISAAARDRH